MSNSEVNNEIGVGQKKKRKEKQTVGEIIGEVDYVNMDEGRNIKE